jgi:hypothetical protein
MRARSAGFLDVATLLLVSNNHPSLGLEFPREQYSRLLTEMLTQCVRKQQVGLQSDIGNIGVLNLKFDLPKSTK